MKRLIACISILILLSSVGMAASGSVRIWGTNVSTAQKNTSVSLAPQNITILSWDGNTTTFSSTVNNASDTITFSIANQTVGRVLELKVNNTVVNGYQVNSTGWVTFTRTQTTSNQTYKLTPAVNQGGWNLTWARVWHGIQFGNRTQPGLVINTIYWNSNVSGGNPLLINVVLGGSNSGEDVWFDIGTSNPPPANGYGGICTPPATNDYCSITAIVLPGEFFKLTAQSGSPIVAGSTIWVIS